MKSILFLLAFLLCAFAPLREVSAAQLIRDGKLQTDLNANTNRITNATDVVTASGVSLTNLAAQISASGATQVVFTAVASSTNYIATSSLTGQVLFVQYCVTNGAAGGGAFTTLIIGTNTYTTAANLQTESNLVLRTAGTTNYIALAGILSGALTFNGSINANDHIEIANSKHLRFQDGGGTNTVHLAATAGRLIISGGVDIVTGQAVPATINGSAVATASDVSARLASNVWATAGSTTNYALRRDGRGSPIYGIGNVYSDGGHAAVNDMNTRLDLRSTNKSFAALGLFQMATNLNTDWPPGLDLWNYGSTVTGVIPENVRSAKIVLGVHTAQGTWGPQLYGIWGGASNDGFGMVTAFADSFGLPQERTRVTWQGLTVSGAVTATGFSSTNVLEKTGGTINGNLTVDTQSGPDIVRFRVDGDGIYGYTASGGNEWLFNNSSFTLTGVPYVGSGAGLVNIPLTALRITNTPSAGQVLATSNGTNGYWATVTGGGGGSGVATNFIGIGAASTNLWVITTSNAVLTVGTNSYRITFRP